MVTVFLSIIGLSDVPKDEMFCSVSFSHIWRRTAELASQWVFVSLLHSPTVGFILALKSRRTEIKIISNNTTRYLPFRVATVA